MKKYIAECLGTATLVLLGCGSATIANLGGVVGGGQAFAPVGLEAIALSFGLAVTAMAYGVPIAGAVCAGLLFKSRVLEG